MASEQYLAHRKNPDKPKPNVSPYALTYYVKPLRKLYPFLKEVDAQSLQNNLQDLGRAYTNFFKWPDHYGRPNFKSKQGKQSFRLSRISFAIKEDGLVISKLRKSPIKVLWSRDLPSEPSSVTISKTSSGRYFASFVCEYQPTRKHGRGFVGIDLGLKTLAVTKEDLRQASSFRGRSRKVWLKKNLSHSL